MRGKEPGIHCSHMHLILLSVRFKPFAETNYLCMSYMYNSYTPVHINCCDYGYCYYYNTAILCKMMLFPVEGVCCDSIF